MTTYILQKDLPDSKAGDEYIWNISQQAYCRYGNDYGPNWLKEFVEDNEEWFLPFQADEIAKAKELLESKGYVVSVGNQSTPLIEYWKNHYGQHVQKLAITEAFNAARLSVTDDPYRLPLKPKFDTAEDYLKSLTP